MTTASHKASLIALLLGLCAAAVLGGIAWDAIRKATPDRSPAEAIRRHASAQRALHHAQAANAAIHYTTAWDKRMIADHQFSHVAGMPPAIDYAALNPTPGADLAATARQCLAQAMKREPRAKIGNCYVFASQDAFDALNYMPTLRSYSSSTSYPLSNLCYAVKTSILAVGDRPTTTDMRASPGLWDGQGCPPSWKGA